MPARHAEPPDRPLVVEPAQHLADRCIELGEAVEGAVAQASDQPALDHQYRLLDLGLVPRAAWPRRQDRRVVMRCLLGVAAVDLRIVEARLDDSRLGIVRHDQRRHAADRLERADMSADPIGQALRPGRLRIGQARGAQHRDEDLRSAPLTGEAIDHHRDAVARIVHEQLVAGGVRLAHRHRQAAFPGPVEFTEAAIAVAIRLGGDVFLPEDRQRYMLALELAVNGRPVGLRSPPLAWLGAGPGKQPLLQNRVRNVVRKRPAQSRRLVPADRQPHRRGHCPDPPPDLPDRKPCCPQPHHIAHVAHRKPPHRHPIHSFQKPKGGGLSEPEEAASPRAI